MTNQEITALFTTAKAEKEKFTKFGQLFMSVAQRIETLKTLSAEDIQGFMPILKADYEKLCRDAPNVFIAENFELVEDTTAFSIALSAELKTKKALHDQILGL